MALIPLTVVVSDIVGVRAVFDQIQVFRSTTGLNGAYVEITDGSTRIPLVIPQIVYQYVDHSGDEAYFYKTQFYNSATGEVSALSDAQQGSGDPALGVISVDELKTNFLFGVDLTDDDGEPFPDSMFQFYIKAAVGWVERKLDIFLRTVVITNEKYHFNRHDVQRNMYVHLINYPVISVESLGVFVPNNQQILDVDLNTVEVDLDTGEIEIIPDTIQFTLGTNGVWFPMLFNSTKQFPGFYQISYTAGFEKGKIPPELVELVGKVAALGPLNIAGDLVFGAGLAAQSVGLDGLMTSIQTTQSPTNAGYGARITEYWREIKQSLPDLRRYYKGVRMVVS